MGKEPISAKQQEILQVIKDAILQKGYPPAVREICAAVDLRSTSTVHAHLEKLEQAGYIRRDPAKNRSIEIVDDDFGLTRREMANIPIVGRVAAGAPLLAEQNIEGYYPMPVEMLPNADVFILKVHGDSMAEMGILDGDSVLCAQTSTADNGDVVVALVEDSATVKRFYKENGHYRLQPENAAYEPIIVDECSVLGKVFGLLRLGIH